MAEKNLEEEVESLTQRLKSMEEELSLARSTSSLVAKVQAVNSRAKPDVYRDGPWEEWENHFKLCAEINQWDDEQCCQQLAVSLRGRAQSVYITLSTEEKSSYQALLDALGKKMTPPQERVIHKLAFRQKKREKGEKLVDLATHLRRLAAKAYSGQDSSFIEDEIVDQFISALDSKELRLGVSQTSPKNLDEALSTALKLESLYEIETKKNRETRINMADVVLEETAGVHTVGSRQEDIPAWARTYFEQQTKLMEKLLEATTSSRAREEKKKSAICYKCGKMGHYQRECRSEASSEYPSRLGENQGNANRAGSRRV